MRHVEQTLEMIFTMRLRYDARRREPGERFGENRAALD
jgi:hypothetical protein